jgi:L-fuculokinase
MYSFNTLFKLLWLKENEPSVYRRMDKFLFISSIFNQRLTGRQTTDLTMAGTSMMTALTRQSWHNSALGLLGLNQDHFPDTVAPGEVIGQLTPAAARQLGLKSGIAVVSSGHDTQFALFGSGASLNQPVLSSGTWEILMTRVNQVNLTPEHRDLGITTEWDAETARYNPGLQWLGSGALEWLTNLLFPELKDSPARYKKMIDEALQNSPGAGGVRFAPPLSLGRDGHSGMLSGMSIRATRGQIYRAALESMALQTRRGLSTLEELGHFQTQSLICVGGGSRNGLWNQIRADVLGKPVEVVSQAETTVLGAAMFAFSGIGRFASAQNAQQQMAPIRQRILPGAQTSDYARLFPI